MPRIHTLISPLVAALAIVALAAPPTLAGPGGPAGAAAVAASQHVQELDRLKAGSGTPAGETGPVYWSYDHEAPVPQAARSVDAADRASPWTAVAAAAGVCLLLGAAGAMAGRTRLRDRRGRVAA